MDVDIEYEGGQKQKPNASEDNDEWVTDDDEILLTDSKLNGSKDFETSNVKSRTGPVSQSSREVPLAFDILDDSPSDHHFAESVTPMNGEIMRRIGKEHKILASSLPDGVLRTILGGTA